MLMFTSAAKPRNGMPTKQTREVTSNTIRFTRRNLLSVSISWSICSMIAEKICLSTRGIYRKTGSNVKSPEKNLSTFIYNAAFRLPKKRSRMTGSIIRLSYQIYQHHRVPLHMEGSYISPAVLPCPRVHCLVYRGKPSQIRIVCFLLGLFAF